jgi:fructose-1,6-bisphosphatase I
VEIYEAVAFTDRKIITLEQFIIEREHEVEGATGSFSQVIRDIALAARVVNREVNKAGLVDILGLTGAVNVQGEEVQKLDEFANNQLIETLNLGGQVCCIGSEENDDIIPLSKGNSENGEYVVMMDPLDGSSNIEVNISIGTIFSIYRRKSSYGPVTTEDYLRPGTDQLAAGYVIYGSSTMMVFTSGHGVNGFTLDPSIGEFLLSHPAISIPENCGIYSTNEGNVKEYSEGMRRYLDHVKGLDGKLAKPYSSRYIGSMVADVHRNLLKGGIFIYPETTSAPNGKLRLMFEANPMAFIAEQAGGAATNGQTRIMEMIPSGLHQRTPLFIGNTSEVVKVQQFLNQNEARPIHNA